METELIYIVALRHPNGRTLEFESGKTREYAEAMLKWYLAHKEWFVGEFYIMEKRTVYYDN